VVAVAAGVGGTVGAAVLVATGGLVASGALVGVGVAAGAQAARIMLKAISTITKRRAFFITWFSSYVKQN
jgi:hypothetical protein